MGGRTEKHSLSSCPISRHGRLAWKVKGPVLTWRKPSSWSLVLIWMSYRNQASIPVLSAARVLATTPLSDCSASYGSTRGAAASLADWWTSGTTSAPVVKTSHCPLTVDQWPKWMLTAPSLMWRTFSAIWVTYCALVGAVTVPLLPDAAWPGESSGNYCLSSPPGTSLLRYMARYTWPVSAWLCSIVVIRGVRTSWT